MDTQKHALEETDVIDVEIHAREGKAVPKAKSYRIRIDKEFKVIHQEKITGKEILALVGKTPEA